MSRLVEQMANRTLVVDPSLQREGRAGFVRRFGATLIERLMAGMPSTEIMLNDRKPDASPDAEARYAVLNGAHLIEAAAAWFDGEALLPARLVPEAEVTRTELVDTAAAREVPHTRITWLTDNGRQYVDDHTHVGVAIAALPNLEAEQAVYLYLNSQHPAPSPRRSARARNRRDVQDGE